jgi:hypothetical protein
VGEFTRTAVNRPVAFHALSLTAARGASDDNASHPYQDAVGGFNLVEHPDERIDGHAA